VIVNGLPARVQLATPCARAMRGVRTRSFGNEGAEAGTGGRVGRWARACVALAAVVGVEGVAAAQAGPPHEAAPPNPAVLVAARELFREATEDVDAGRFDVALDKFKRVAQVKETPPVRFNIAKCEQALGRLGAALADYELAEREGEDDPKFADIVKLADAQATGIRPRVPRLTVAAAAPLATDARVTLDGEPLAPAGLGVPLPLDPGHHRVVVTDATGPVFAEDVDLTQALTARVEIKVARESKGGTSGRTIAGLAAFGGAALLGGASIVFTVFHNGAVSDLKTLCNVAGGACLESNRDRAETLHGNAVVDKNLAIGFAIGAGVAAGVGAVLFFGGRGSTPKTGAAHAWIAPFAAPHGPPGLAAGGTF
jgi:hypothetical protein